MRINDTPSGHARCDNNHTNTTTPLTAQLHLCVIALGLYSTSRPVRPPLFVVFRLNAHEHIFSPHLFMGTQFTFLTDNFIETMLGKRIADLMSVKHNM
jgi:hypothetical protein